MCSGYETPTRVRLKEQMRQLPLFDWLKECYPERQGPFLANVLPDEWLLGQFGLVHHYSKEHAGRRTYNARSEDVLQRPTYKQPWLKRQLAIIPVESFFEPRYSTLQKSERYRIWRRDGKLIGIAGLWQTRFVGEEKLWSFTMLTTNADEHPFMRQFHRPGDEKRSVVVLDDDEWDDWLSAKTEDDLRYFMRLFDPDMMDTAPYPIPPRASEKLTAADRHP